MVTPIPPLATLARRHYKQLLQTSLSDTHFPIFCQSDAGVDNQEQTPIESVPNAAASRFNTPDATASPESETDKTDELPVFTPFSTPIDSSPPGGSSPTILLPQDQLSLTQPQSFKASGSQTPASDLQTPRSSGNQTPKPSGYQNPKPSGLRTPVPSRLQTPRASGAQTPSESPKLFSGAQSSPQSHKRPAPVELLPAGGSPHTPRTPLFRGAPPASADVMLTPSVSPLGWQPDAGGQGPQEPGSGPGQSTPAAIQMPSVQRSASRVTPDVIRTPGLSRRLNLDADEPGRTPGRTPLSRFALKSPIGGARRVPLFDGVEKLTPAKTFTPGRIVGATGGVKEGAPEKLTPAVRIKVGGANGVNEVASEKLTPAARATPGAAVARAAGANEGAIEAVKSTSVESQAECEVTLTSTLNQITEFPVVLNGGKSLKPSPLNLSGTAKPASTPKSVSPPNVQHPEPAANASQGGDIDQSQGVGLNPTEGKQPALSGFARMVGHVATDTVAQESAKDHGASQVQSGSGAVMRGSAGKKGGPVRGGVVASGQSANGSGQGPKKGATSEVERWLRRARGQASPVTPADRTGPGITPVNQVRAPVEANLAASEEDPSGVDFPTVEDNGASADTANFTEPAPGVNTAGVNASGKESNPSVKTPHFGVRTLRNRQSPGETMGRRRGASEAGSVKTPVPGGTPLAQGVNTPKSGSKGTPMLRQERARLPHLVIDNSKRTPVSGEEAGTLKVVSCEGLLQVLSYLGICLSTVGLRY